MITWDFYHGVWHRVTDGKKKKKSWWIISAFLKSPRLHNCSLGALSLLPRQTSANAKLGRPLTLLIIPENLCGSPVLDLVMLSEPAGHSEGPLAKSIIPAAEKSSSSCAAPSSLYLILLASSAPREHPKYFIHGLNSDLMCYLMCSSFICAIFEDF